MPKSLLLFCFLCLTLITTAQDSLYWQKVVYSNEYVKAQFAINKKDEIYVVGIFSDSLEWEGKKIYGKEGNKGNSSIFIAKYNCLDNLMWIKVVGYVDGGFSINGCVIDSVGDLVFASDESAGVHFFKEAGDTVYYRLRNGCCLVRFDKDGNYKLCVPIYPLFDGSATIGYTGNEGVSITTENKILITGRLNPTYKDTIYVGSKFEITHTESMFYSIIDTNGNVELLHRMPDSLVSFLGFDATTDNWDNIYVSSMGLNYNGYFEGIPYILPKGTTSYITKYNPNGKIVWVKPLGDESRLGSINHLKFDFYSGKLYFHYRGKVHYENGDSSIYNNFIQSLDTSGKFGFQLPLFNGMDFCLNNKGEIFSTCFQKFSNLGLQLTEKKCFTNNYSLFNDIVVNSKNEIYLLGNNTIKKNKLDSFSLGSGKSNLFLAKLSYKFPIQNTKPIFAIYPNPAKTQILIQSQNNLINQIRIIDVLGKNVLEFFNENNKNNFTIDINALQTGIYFVQAISGKETSVQQLLVN